MSSPRSPRPRRSRPRRLLRRKQRPPRPMLPLRRSQLPRFPQSRFLLSRHPPRCLRLSPKSRLLPLMPQSSTPRPRLLLRQQPLQHRLLLPLLLQHRPHRRRGSSPPREAPVPCVAKNRRRRARLPSRRRLLRLPPLLRPLRRPTPHRVPPLPPPAVMRLRVRRHQQQASPFRRPLACVRPRRQQENRFRRRPVLVAISRPPVAPVVPVPVPVVLVPVPADPAARVPAVLVVPPAVPAVVSVVVPVVPEVPVVGLVVVPVAVVVPVVVPVDRVARSAARAVVVAVRTNSSRSMHRVTPRARRLSPSA